MTISSTPSSRASAASLDAADAAIDGHEQLRPSPRPARGSPRRSARSLRRCGAERSSRRRPRAASSIARAWPCRSCRRRRSRRRRRSACRPRTAPMDPLGGLGAAGQQFRDRARSESLGSRKSRAASGSVTPRQTSNCGHHRRDARRASRAAMRSGSCGWMRQRLAMKVDSPCSVNQAINIHVIDAAIILVSF